MSSNVEDKMKLPVVTKRKTKFTIPKRHMLIATGKEVKEVEERNANRYYESVTKNETLRGVTLFSLSPIAKDATNRVVGDYPVFTEEQVDISPRC